MAAVPPPAEMSEVVLDGSPLSPAGVVAVARGGVPVRVDPGVSARMAPARDLVERIVAEAGGEILVVSQFTLYGDTRRGRRPSWSAAARPGQAEPLVDRLVEALRGLGATVATGRFAAHMHVELLNDGPVTVTLEA